MRDIYHSRVPWIGAFFAGLWCPRYWALTFGQTTWWTVGPELIDFHARRHEACHQRQFARDGRLRFLWRYAWEWLGGLFRYHRLRDAYLQISYEVEARKAEGD